MENVFLGQMLSLIVILLITIGVYFFSKKTKLPYTIMLVITGLLLIPLAQIPVLSFIGNFKLTPDILFYVFLPILLFESAYNINYRDLLKDRKNISVLAIIGLIMSACIIAVILFYTLPIFGVKIDFLMVLLFGILISATDPVAVLALFKTLGAPKRLTLIFEGESLFNDGTALAFFTVILSIVVNNAQVTTSTFITGIGSFFSMAIGGAFFGIFMGIIFSKIIKYIKNNETIEIMMTMIVAHLTFILAELITHYVSIGGFHLALSGVIATTFAAIVMGNYGRYKISPKVEEYMEKFWSFFAFVSNSLVFILLGFIVSAIRIPLQSLWLPIAVSIIAVMLGRALSVYVPLFTLEKIDPSTKIPLSWQHLLSWGSLRGALAIMMVVMIPDNIMMGVGETIYSLKDFLLVITIACILFTLFLKAPTIIPMMKNMRINDLQDTEKIGYMEGMILINIKSLEKLHSAVEKGHITPIEYNDLSKKYELKLQNAIQTMKIYCANHEKDIEPIIEKTITLHALGIEKQYLKDLFVYNEVDEKSFNAILYTIRRQIERIEHDQPQIKSLEEKMNLDIYQKMRLFSESAVTPVDEYIKYRAKIIITRKVIRELSALKEIDFGFDNVIFDSTIALYQKFHTIATQRKEQISLENRDIISQVESRLMEKSIFKLEEKVLHNLYEKNMITHLTYQQLQEQINTKIDSQVHSTI